MKTQGTVNPCPVIGESSVSCELMASCDWTSPIFSFVSSGFTRTIPMYKYGNNPAS